MRQFKNKLKGRLRFSSPGRSDRETGKDDTDRSPPKAQPTPSEPSRYGLELLNDPSLKTGDEGTQYQVDIVAIHGLNGHPRNTWTHSDKTLWLRDILPHDLPGAAIFTYGYPSELFFSKSIADVEDFSLRLLNDLSNKISRDDDLRPIIYICHSLGGIVFKMAMNIAFKKYQEVWLRSKGVVFFGTPHQGSETAPMGELFGNIVNAAGFALPPVRTKLISMLRQNSPELKKIADEFAERSKKFQIMSFYETEILRPLGRVVVDKTSAVLDLKHEKSCPIYRDHREMCRFASRDKEYTQAFDAIKRIAETAILKITDEGASTHSAQSFNSAEKRCVEWLSSMDISSYLAHLDRPAEGTLTWIFQTTPCATWLSKKETKLLLVTGYAGCGKTTLSTHMFQYLSENSAPGSINCQFFCSGKSELQQDPVVVIQTLLYQVVIRKRKLLRVVQRASDSLGSSIFRQFDVLWDLLVQIAQHETVSSINIVIDAIDECPGGTQRLLTTRIARLLDSASEVPIKFFITSRPQAPAIETIQKNTASLNRLKLEDNHSLIAGDVRLMIKQRVNLLVETNRCPEEFRDELEGLLATKAEGTFLWVSLVLNSLQNRRLLTNISALIHEIPSGLSNLYRKFLSDIPDGDERMIASKILGVIVAAARPLNSKEISALLPKDTFRDSGKSVSLRPESIELLLNPLVQVRNSEIYLVHHSIKEFLLALSQSKEDPLASHFGVDLASQSAMLAQSCIDYLLSDQFASNMFETNSPSGEFDSPELPFFHSPDGSSNGDENRSVFMYDLQDASIFKDEAAISDDRCTFIAGHYELFDYAARFWTAHFSSCGDVSDDELLNHAIQLYNPSKSQMHNWFRYFWLSNNLHEDFPQVLDPLIVAAFFGHSTVEHLLKEPELDMNYGHALFRAAERGHLPCLEKIFVKFKEGQEKINSCYHLDRSPLAAAAQNGHQACVDFLLKADVFELNGTDRAGRTPLSLASMNGHVSTVSRLLSESDMQPDIPDRSGYTALFWATTGNSQLVVQLLLQDRRVNPSLKDKWGRNVLSWAAEEGHIAVASILLRDKRIDINNADKAGRTPLIYAVQNRHYEIVRMLARNKRIDLSLPDNTGRNAISWACESTESILSYLVKKNPKGADFPDESGWTPISWALNPPGYLQHVSLLLESGLVNINHVDQLGQTPLHYAARYGYLEITQKMLSMRGVNVNQKDPYGRTPLSQAALSGHLEIVRLLINVPGIDWDVKDSTGRTPLSLAAGVGKKDVVSLLMSMPGVDLETADADGHTPIWYYAHSQGGQDGALEPMSASLAMN